MTSIARKQQGFTLIELLVVIAIIGVLAAVVLIAINPARRLAQTRDSGRKNDINQIVTAIESYYTLNRQYPQPSGPVSGLSVLTLNQDIKVLPIQPNGLDYSYTLDPTSTEAAVYASLEDPTSGTGSFDWCWSSTAGRASEVTAGSCIP